MQDVFLSVRQNHKSVRFRIELVSQMSTIPRFDLQDCDVASKKNVGKAKTEELLNYLSSMQLFISQCKELLTRSKQDHQEPIAIQPNSDGNLALRKSIDHKCPLECSYQDLPIEENIDMSVNEEDMEPFPDSGQEFEPMKGKVENAERLLNLEDFFGPLSNDEAILTSEALENESEFVNIVEEYHLLPIEAPVDSQIPIASSDTGGVGPSTRAESTPCKSSKDMTAKKTKSNVKRSQRRRKASKFHKKSKEKHILSMALGSRVDFLKNDLLFGISDRKRKPDPSYSETTTQSSTPGVYGSGDWSNLNPCSKVGSSQETFSQTFVW